MPTVTRRSVRSRRRAVPTEREMTVLVAYLELGSYKAVAGALDLSEARVADALANVRSKTGSANTAQAVWRLRQQLAPPRSDREMGRENKV